MNRRTFLKNCIFAGPAMYCRRLWAEFATNDSESTNMRHPLSALQFRNSGRVDTGMQFAYLDQLVAYAEGEDHWHVESSLKYLYEIKQGEKLEPPSGMRSAVPLGGLGAGTLELRADGCFQDWQIFNNSPAGGDKIQIDDTFFGIRVQGTEDRARAFALRTHPPDTSPQSPVPYPLSPVSTIEYNGAFPVSRLRFSDPALPLDVTLYAYSAFRPFEADLCSTPSVLFTFVVHNSANEPIEASLLFNVRNWIAGRVSCDRKLKFEKSGTEPTSGALVVDVAGSNLSITGGGAEDLAAVWREFSAEGEFTKSRANIADLRYGALAVKLILPPGEVKTVTYALAWYLPNRPYLHSVPGNHYTCLFENAEEVAASALRNSDTNLAAITTWQQSLFANSLPHWLQDALINSAATMYKTGAWFENGDFAQWESFSCAGLNPGHIDFYRNLPYAFFFPKLNKDLLRLHADSQDATGFIPEQLTTGCFGPTSELGQPGGRQMGDSETVFLLWAWQIYAWTGDKSFLDGIWPYLKKAAQWQIGRSAKYGLPTRLQNTYDWWEFDKKDLVAYNGFLHLAAMRAAEKIAQVESDEGLAKQYRAAFERGSASLGEHLWTGEYYRAWWMDGVAYPDALHADTLYGQLWAYLLDLGPLVDESKLQQHLRAESKLNASPFGLKVMRRADPNHPETESRIPDPKKPDSARDNLVWQAGSLDWCALGLYLGFRVEECLAEAEKIISNCAEKLHDQWNYTDITTAWDGMPWCNSHYARQLVFWSIPLALSGQQYFAPAGRLTFDPRVPAPTELPFFTPTAFGRIELLKDGSCHFGIDSGKLQLRELRIADAAVRTPLLLRTGESFRLEGRL